MSTNEERLLSKLHAAVHLHYGRIAEIERTLKREPGYLSKVVRGERPLTTRELFAILDILNEPADGFLRSLHDLDILGLLKGLPAGPRNSEEIAQLRRTAPLSPNMASMTMLASLPPRQGRSPCATMTTHSWAEHSQLELRFGGSTEIATAATC